MVFSKIVRSVPVRLLLCSPFGLVLIGGGGCDDQPARQTAADWELQGHYQRANEALLDHKWQLAEKEFRLALARDARYVPALNGLARTLYKMPASGDQRNQHVEEAIRLLDQVLALQADNRPAWSWLARIAQEEHRSDRAIQALTKLMTLDPDQVDHLLNLARTTESAGKLQDTERLLLKGLKTFTANDEVRLALGRVQLRLDKTDQAVATLGQIPMCPPANKQEPNAGKPDGGVAPKPACPTTTYYLAQDELGALAVKRGDLKSARAIYDRLVQMYPGDYMAWEVLAALDERDQRWKDAEEKYRQSLAIDRAHFSGWRGLGRVQLAQGKGEDARYSFRQADGLLADYPQGAIGLADDLVHLGDRQWALSVLDRARILLAGQRDLLEQIDKKKSALAASPAAADEAGNRTDEKHNPNGNH